MRLKYRIPIYLFLSVAILIMVYILERFSPSGGGLAWLLVMIMIMLSFELSWQILVRADKRIKQSRHWVHKILSLFFINWGLSFLICMTCYVLLKILIWNNSIYKVHFILMLTMNGIFCAFSTTIYQLQQISQKWHLTQLEKETLAKENLNFKFQLLKNQLSPHFLFNNINTLYGLIDNNQPLAKDCLLKLSEVYRYILQLKEEPIVSYETELQMLRAYIFLLKIRFGKAINIELKDAEKLNGFGLPPLVLQLLVENAFKHNKFDEELTLVIRLYLSDTYFVVENTFRPIKKPIANLGIGLNNIQNRYQLLMDKPVKVEQTETLFKVHLPLISFSETLN